MVYDKCQSSGTPPIYIIWLKNDVKQTMIIPEGPAALPDLILLMAIDTISFVILIASPSTGASLLIFVAFHGNSTFESFW